LFADLTEGGWWVWDVLGLLSIPALVAVNGLFVAAEFALVAVRKTRIEELVKQNVPGSKAALHGMEHLNRTIAATQLGITLASIALGFVGEPALERLLRPVFDWVPQGWHSFATHTVAWFLAFLLITLMHVVFGELIPKTLALRAPDQTALWLARPLLAFVRLTRPLTLLASGVASLVLGWLGVRGKVGEEHAHSVEELLLLIEDTEEAGILDPDQADFIENVFRLSNKRVRECLVPRDKMAALELNTPSDKVLEAVRSGAHTRMPVYEGTLDNIVGVVNTKDLFHLFSLQGVVNLYDAIYPALFLKPDESMANALRLFRKNRRPMALVRDDDGHIHGLLTLEDVLEEIVGDIEDEHDRPTARLRLRRRPGLSPKLPAPLPRERAPERRP
jgi:CBS domain containing-hemolysin-like protein